MRLFVSIDLPEKVQKELDQWLPEIPGIRKTRPEQLHLTLLFLGECSPAEKNSIIKKLKSIPFAPFEITVHGIGAFPNRKKPSVIWAGAEKTPELLKLNKNIKASLKEFTSNTDMKTFKPHITLGRVKSGLNVENLFSPGKPVQLKVNHFSLKKSMLKKSGSIHKIVWSS